jgi:uncharacterized protein (TIGR02284 family)
MATLIGKETNIVDLLIHLMELDYDVIAAYMIAVDRLEHPGYKARMREFLADHERHIQDLYPVVIDLGGTPPQEGDIKAVLTQGKVRIAQIAGDTGILAAMRSNEDDTNTAYERALIRLDVPSRIRVILEQNLADERRHRAWIEDCLARPRKHSPQPTL